MLREKILEKNQNVSIAERGAFDERLQNQGLKNVWNEKKTAHLNVSSVEVVQGALEIKLQSRNQKSAVEKPKCLNYDY